MNQETIDALKLVRAEALACRDRAAAMSAGLDSMSGLSNEELKEQAMRFFLEARRLCIVLDRTLNCY